MDDVVVPVVEFVNVAHEVVKAKTDALVLVSVLATTKLNVTTPPLGEVIDFAVELRETGTTIVPVAAVYV